MTHSVYPPPPPTASIHIPPPPSTSGSPAVCPLPQFTRACASAEPKGKEMNEEIISGVDCPRCGSATATFKWEPSRLWGGGCSIRCSFCGFGEAHWDGLNYPKSKDFLTKRYRGACLDEKFRRDSIERLIDVIKTGEKK